MTDSGCRVPLGLRLAAWLLPEPYRDEMLGDLVEAWRVAKRNRGLAGSTLWVWRQPFVALGIRVVHRIHVPAAAGGRPAVQLPGGVSALDVKLGLRMLRKHPGITVVAVSSMAMAVAFVAGFTAFSANVYNPRLPFDDGDQIVAVTVWDTETRTPESRLIHEFEAWRSGLTSISELGGFQPTVHNLSLEGGRVVPVRGSEVTASTFEITRVPPLLGRVLLRSDAADGAPPVALLGFDLWESLFGGDPSVIGTNVRLGNTPHEIVGVMPHGFRFPYADQLWAPLRVDASDWNRREGPALFVFGRLAEGASLAEAQAEVVTRWQRTREEYPASHGSLAVRVQPYTASFGAAPPSVVFGGRLFFTLILILACANVGTLLAARNSTRSAELTIRAALGAGRRRIAVQLFVEALVLSAVATAVGLALTILGLGQLEPLVGEHVFGNGLPFWWQGGLAPKTIAYVVIASLIGAMIAGALPALKATAGPLTPRLQRSSGGLGGTGVRLPAWVIPVQVAISIAAMALVLGQAPHSLTREIDIPGLAASEYLTSELGMGSGVELTSDPTEFLKRYAAARLGFAERLAQSPEVDAFSFTTALPGTRHRQQRVELEGQRDDIRLLPVRVAHIEPDFFSTMGLELLAGRSFDSADFGEDGEALPVVIVNASLALSRLGTTEVVGRRLRFLNADRGPGPWLEVVGVVPDFGMNLEETAHKEGFYRPLTHSAYPVSVAVRVGPDAMRMASTLRAAGVAADPGLAPQDVRTMESIIVAAQLEERIVFFGVAIPTAVALLLALSGVNALVSLAVTQRTSEIGIRIALGARPERVAYHVARGTLGHVAIGVAVGLAVTVFLSKTVYAADDWRLVVRAGLVVVATGAIACAAPIRRALGIEPSRAFRDTG